MKKYITTVCILSLILLGVSFAPMDVQACSCAWGVSQDESYANSSALFSGEVVAISQAEEEERNQMQNYLTVWFDINTSWKGVESDGIAVMTGRNSAMCGQHFSVGESYLVYAGERNSSGGKFHVSSCSRTSVLDSQQAQADIDKLGEGEEFPGVPEIDSVATSSSSLDATSSISENTTDRFNLFGWLADLVRSIF